MMTTKGLTAVQAKCLRDQVITVEQPGTVLRDFQMLLDFLGSGGVEASGKYNLLPIKFIAELDRRLSRPLHLELQRPQLKSHPYLMGLHLLLRASGLSRVEEAGAKSRLALDPEMLVQWDTFNPTERYFHLLEAWLRFGRADMVAGEVGGAIPGQAAAALCESLGRPSPRKAAGLELDRPQDLWISGVSRDNVLRCR